MRIEDFKDIHKGKRAFIACNGPSLNDIPVAKLKNDVVFGLNRGYLKKDLPITYLVNIVKSIVDQWGHEISQVPCEAFFTNHFEGDNVVKLQFGGRKGFHTDLTQPIYRGNTVTYVALQIAYWMGFTTVYCIGLDHSFSYSNTVRDKSHRRAVITKGNDPNHFDPNYFGDGAVWLPYEPIPVENGYRMAREAYEKDGRVLLNASTKTQLSKKIMPRISFSEIGFE